MPTFSSRTHENPLKSACLYLKGEQELRGISSRLERGNPKAPKGAKVSKYELVTRPDGSVEFVVSVRYDIKLAKVLRANAAFKRRQLK